MSEIDVALSDPSNVDFSDEFQDLCNNTMSNGLFKGKKYKKNDEAHFLISDIKWLHVAVILLIHVFGIYGALTYPYVQHWRTFMWSFFCLLIGSFGVTGGAHRYWTHRTYKATIPMQILLAICFSFAGQNSIYNWVRDHRVHHKHSDTNADPHNINRGLFFAHVGWLMVKKHPDVINKGKQIDMTDIENDPVVAFFEKHFILSKLVCAFGIPIGVPMIFWNETFYHSVTIQICKYMLMLNATWSVNSIAHYFGTKPYNKNIAPTENEFVSLLTLGEGWHNYHHVFPMDYRTAEIGNSRLSLTTIFIDFFAKIGWIYDLRVPSVSLTKTIIEKEGDGTHNSSITPITNVVINWAVLFIGITYLYSVCFKAV